MIEKAPRTVEKILDDNKQETVQKQTDNVLSEIPELPKCELGDPLLNIFSTKANDIFKTDYKSNKDLNERNTR